MNYLVYEIKNNLDKNIVLRANYILVRIYRIHNSKRIQLPSDNEIYHIENMRPIMFPIYFFSDASTVIPLESYNTISEMKNKILTKVKLNIVRCHYYALFEICNKQDIIEERYLEESDKIVDILTIWDKEMETHKKLHQTVEFKIYLKQNLYYGYKDDDIDTVTINYVQTRYDVNLGKYNLSEETIVKLASLQLLINNYNKSHEEAYALLEKNLDQYIPIQCFRRWNKREWIDKVMGFFSTLSIKSRQEAKLSYLEQIKQTNLWEAQQFVVKVKIFLSFSFLRLIIVRI